MPARGGFLRFGTESASDHESLLNLQGGAPGEHVHLTNAETVGLTGGGATLLHSHPIGPGASGIVEVNANYTVDVSMEYVLVNPAPAAPVEIQLPDGVLHSTKSLYIKDKAKMTSNPLTRIKILPFAGQTVDADTELWIDNDGACVHLVFLTDNWNIL